MGRDSESVKVGGQETGRGECDDERKERNKCAFEFGKAEEETMCHQQKALSSPLLSINLEPCRGFKAN